MTHIKTKLNWLFLKLLLILKKYIFLLVMDISNTGINVQNVGGISTEQQPMQVDQSRQDKLPDTLTLLYLP